MSGAHQADPWRNTILLGDARTRLADLPPASVDCVITSPPYYGLRDYGTAGQIGLEADVASWVADLRAVLAEVARVLKPSGVLWLNLGDGYARHPREGAPVKSLLLGPERLALSLLADGWRLRNKVIWAKTNPMPSSIRDRLSASYEVVYSFTRARSYFFDLDAIRVPHRSAQPPQASATGRAYPPASAVATVNRTRRTNRNTGLGSLKVNGLTGHPLGKNPGDVWWLATAGYREAHFATFPIALAERPLLASCPERVCVGCGKPWTREPARRRGHLAVLGELRPSCDCQVGFRPGVVLDPFLGAGTVAVAAERHGREWVGIELNPEYAALAEARIVKARTKIAAGRVGEAQASPEVSATPAAAGAVAASTAGPDQRTRAVARQVATRTAAVRPHDPRAA
ncbi:DNA-methyltransferase [Frankia sp. CiP1_Cm_nod2]|uniref:DNA-methyltransferase n=1 Tax=Frankia sp. CiP1_Cm_nod2 TaxID=2897161 RepID=UPI002025311D